MKTQDRIYHNPELASQAPAFAALGENVGMGPSCESIHEAFMSSPGHRANILDRDYTHLGVGAEWRDDPDSSTGIYIYVTQVFMRPRATPNMPPTPPPARKPQPRCTCPR